MYIKANQLHLHPPIFANTRFRSTPPCLFVQARRHPGTERSSSLTPLSLPRPSSVPCPSRFSGLCRMFRVLVRAHSTSVSASFSPSTAAVYRPIFWFVASSLIHCYLICLCCLGRHASLVPGALPCTCSTKCPQEICLGVSFQVFPPAILSTPTASIIFRRLFLSLSNLFCFFADKADELMRVSTRSLGEPSTMFSATRRKSSSYSSVHATLSFLTTPLNQHTLTKTNSHCLVLKNVICKKTPNLGE